MRLPFQKSNMEIEIKCQGATLVNIHELNELQGSLKTLDENNYVKLRNSIIKFGFSFPIFMWIDHTGKKWIVDSHARKYTLMQMEKEGYTIPPLPADMIFAKDKVEAKQKLLVQNSKYGKITAEGMTEFINEEDFQVPYEDIEDMLELPGITEDYEEEEKPKEKKEKIPERITCPSCNYIFDYPNE